MCSPPSRRPGNFRSNGQSKSKNNPAILKRSIVCSLLLLIPVLAFGTQQNAVQDPIGNRIALKWKGEPVPTEEQLQTASEAGIDLLQLSFPTSVSPTALENFFILADTGIRFLTVSEMKANHTDILESATNVFRNIPTELTGKVAAINLFEYPADYDPDFANVGGAIADSLSLLINTPVFYQSALSRPGSTGNGFDFAAGRIHANHNPGESDFTSVLLFEPSASTAESLESLEWVLNRTLQIEESIVILPSNWFFRLAESDPAFLPLIQSYLKGVEITFPKPRPEPELPAPNWPVVVLFGIWITFLLHNKYQPIYRATLPRYFLHHRFFVTDIGELRIRNSMPGLVVMLQHAILGGLAFWLFADSHISGEGLNALLHHFPGLVYPGMETLSTALLFGAAIFFMHLISIFWLYLPARSINYLSQTIQLYHWPLHLNLLNVTAMLFLFLMGSNTFWILTCFVIFLLIFFMSYNLAAFDSTSFLEKYRPLYLILTSGLHLIFWASLAWMIFYLPSLFEPLQMAFHLH